MYNKYCPYFKAIEVEFFCGKWHARELCIGPAIISLKYVAFSLFTLKNVEPQFI